MWKFPLNPVENGAMTPTAVCPEDDCDRRFEEDLNEAVRQSLGTQYFCSASICFEYGLGS
jgi:hypothetical protein